MEFSEGYSVGKSSSAVGCPDRAHKASSGPNKVTKYPQKVKSVLVRLKWTSSGKRKPS